MSVVRHVGRAPGTAYETPVEVDRPEVVPVSMLMQHLPKREQMVLRLVDVRECLQVSRGVS